MRSATLEREQRRETVELDDGTSLEIAGIPLPDGNGLLTITFVAPAARSGSSDGAAGPMPITPAQLQIEQIAPFPFLTSLVREREKSVEAKRLTLNLRGSRNARPVRADPGQLGRAIGLLLDKAITAAPEGGAVQITLGRTRRGSEIAIMGDNFEPLSQQGADADARLVREIVEAHGGQLRLSAIPEAGSAVTIILP